MNRHRVEGMIGGTIVGALIVVGIMVFETYDSAPVEPPVPKVEEPVVHLSELDKTQRFYAETYLSMGFKNCRTELMPSGNVFCNGGDALKGIKIVP